MGLYFLGTKFCFMAMERIHILHQVEKKKNNSLQEPEGYVLSSSYSNLWSELIDIFQQLN